MTDRHLTPRDRPAVTVTPPRSPPPKLPFPELERHPEPSWLREWWPVGAGIVFVLGIVALLVISFAHAR